MDATGQPRQPEGRWLIRSARELAGRGDMTGRVAAAIIDAVAGIRCPEAAADLERRGLERLHEVIDAREVGPLRDRVLDGLRPALLSLAVAVGRQFLDWKDDFFIDDYLILRVYFPYQVARHADPTAENLGAGRLSESVRALFQARKTVDPVFSPFAYHRGHPPAAWAHGPHRDSWAGHSRQGWQIWWAIGEVAPEAGIVLYPELTGLNLPFDPRTLGLRAGYPLPKPTCLGLKAGELLVFNSEVPHGTHLNTSQTTRVSVSMRLSAAKPTFNPACFFAREFWRRASDIEQGQDRILHLPREENLGPAMEPAPPPPRATAPVLAGVLNADSGIIDSGLAREAVDLKRVIVESGPYRVLVAWTSAGLRAYEAACPHYGLDLADGASDGDSLYCPACAVHFDLRTGESACPSLALRSLPVWVTEGRLHIQVNA